MSLEYESMSLECEPSSEPLDISARVRDKGVARALFLNFGRPPLDLVLAPFVWSDILVSLRSEFAYDR